MVNLEQFKTPNVALFGSDRYWEGWTDFLALSCGCFNNDALISATNSFKSILKVASYNHTDQVYTCHANVAKTVSQRKANVWQYGKSLRENVGNVNFFCSCFGKIQLTACLKINPHHLSVYFTTSLAVPAKTASTILTCKVSGAKTKPSKWTWTPERTSILFKVTWWRSNGCVKFRFAKGSS